MRIYISSFAKKFQILNIYHVAFRMKFASELAVKVQKHIFLCCHSDNMLKHKYYNVQRSLSILSTH